MGVFLYRSTETGPCDWVPNVDVYRTSTGWALKFELPGVRAQDVMIRVEGASVRVHGFRRDLYLEKDWRHYSMEISYCRFERTVELPTRVEGARVGNVSREGMLIVRIDVDEEGVR
jgi:HSP20 family protein